jgi:aminoglycoside phosphotransferase (APT) family kinase protein
MNGASVPPATGVRIAWEQVPARLRAKVEAMLGDAVVEAVTQTGGFSPGAAARLRLAGGGRAFVKAVSPEQNPDTPALYRTEARVAAALPATVPSPRLLGTLDEDGWIVLVFEDVDGTMPELPWDPDVLARVVETLAAMAVALDPAPLPAPTAVERYADKFVEWRRLVMVRDGAESASSNTDALAGTETPDPLAWLDSWARRNLDRLAALEAAAPQAATGTALVHMDIRADNLLVTSAGDVVVVDWPWALTGAPWLDLALLAMSVWMHGGRDAARVVTDHALLLAADQDDVSAVVAAFAGLLLGRSREPAPVGLPTLRALQGAVGTAALDWLKARIDEP